MRSNGTEIVENGKKVGVRSSPDVWRDPDELAADREAVCAGIRETNARGAAASPWWTVQFFIRPLRVAHARHTWEMEDRDFS